MILCKRSVFTVLFSFFILSSSVNFVSAQNQQLLLQSGTLVTDENLDSWVQNFDPNQRSWFDGKSWMIIQFDEIPGAIQKQKLKAKGITFLDYLPQHSFIVSIPYGFDPNELKNHKIRSVVEFNSTIRTQRALTELPLPNHAVKADGKIELIISWFENADQNLAITAISELPLTVQSEDRQNGFVTVITNPKEISTIASLPFVNYVEAGNPPELPDNYQARTQHRINGVNTDYDGGRKYDGTGVNIAMGDDGSIGPHIDYKGRVSNTHAASNGGDHGDHVSGTIFGAGNVNPTARGMAPGAFLYAWTGTSNMLGQSQTIYNSESVRITNVSQSNGCNSGYTNLTRTVDKNINETRGLIHVFSAGNEGTNECGQGGLGGTSYGAGVGWGTITGGHKMGKNCLTVGSLTSDGNLSSFSSRGPATDGRIKPEVCGKGSGVFSCMDPNSYQSTSGTSMSCPGVAGACATLYHAYRELNNGDDPESALIKACLMNTATDLGNEGPDFRYGFGEINAYRALTTLEENRYIYDSLSQGDTNTHNITIPAGTAELRVMLHWTDYQAASQASTHLINNLDMQGEDQNNGVFDPWVLDHTNNATALNALPNRAKDNLNNQEQITIKGPVAGNFELRIAGTLVPLGPQSYYVVYEFRDSTPDLRYPIGGEGWIPAIQEKIRWDAPGDFASFDIEYSADSGSTWSLVGTAAAADRRLNWIVPDTVSGNVMMRITRMGMSDGVDTTFSIIKRPASFHVEEACPTSVLLEWNSVAGADYYEVFQLGSKYMDPIDTTSSTQYLVSGLSQFSTYWFSVKAHGTDHAESMRVTAIEKTPGIWNCSVPNDMAVNQVLVPGSGLLFDCSTSGAVNVKIEVESFSPNDMTDIPVFYQVNGGTIVADTITDTIAGFQTGEWVFNAATLSLSTAGTYDIVAWVNFSGDQNGNNDTIETSLEIAAGTVHTVPYREDFESFTNCTGSPTCGNTTCPLSKGWGNAKNNSADEIDWRVYQGPTPTNNSGPSIDKSMGNVFGKYLYTEATNCFEHEAILVSPCIDLSTAVEPHVRFWFHLYGASMGELHTDLFVDGEWTYDIVAKKSADWSDKWWDDDLDLAPWAGKTITMRWRGITGTGGTSDMALDDINFYDATVSRQDNLDAGSIEVFPNPTTGLTQLQMDGIIGNSPIKGKVIDLFGKVVYEFEVPVTGRKAAAEIDLSRLASGIYEITLINEDQNWRSKVSKMD